MTQATGINPYSEQLAWQRQVRQALARSEHRRRLEENAEQAAFPSLMRRPVIASVVSPEDAPTPSPTPPPALTEAFEHLVARTLGEREGLRLDVSARKRLVRQAAALGLSRFDANLLMARVEHYAGTSRATAAEGTQWDARHATPRFTWSRLAWWGLTGLALLLLQGGLVMLWMGLLNLG